MTSFTYDVIDPCDLIGFPANWGLLRNSKNVYPPTYPTYILMTGVVSNETNTYVRMYIEEFILVDIWIHCCTKLKLNWNWTE